MKTDADLNNLENLQPLELNTNAFNSSVDIPLNIMNSVKDSVGDVWFYASILAMFLFFNYLFYRREENFGYDIARTLLISSSFSFLISTSVLLSGWINSIYPTIWFGSLMFIGFVVVYSLKQRNL